MEIQTIADKLLYPVWRGIPDGYKMKYARNIWQQFEDNIRNAAYTSNLSRFYNDLSTRLGVAIRGEDSALVAAVLASGEDRAILRCLREEATTLTLFVRLKNDERRELIRKEHQDDEDLQLRGQDDGPLFDLA